MSQPLLAPAPAPVSPSEPKQKKDLSLQRSVIISILLGSLAIHVVGLILFGVWVVVEKYSKPEAVFQVRETLKIPIRKTPEHKMNVAAHEAAAPKPVFQDKLISTRPSEFALPELPKLDMPQMLPLDPSQLVSDQISSIVGTAGLGSGIGDGLGGGGGNFKGGAMGQFNFMGIRAKGQRIVLCFDVSGSVVNKATASGMPLSRIKDETIKLISGLPTGAQFGIIQFVRNYKPFQKTLTAMTPANRDLAKKWIETEWNETGMMGRGENGVLSPTPNGVVCVLDAAFAMKPDVIFIISDGQFEQSYPEDRRIPDEELEIKMEELQAGQAEKVPVHFIGFQMRPENKVAWGRIVRKTSGRLREIR